MKVNTVEQFKVLKYIEKNFYMTDIEVEIIDQATLKITDHTSESICFSFENGKIVEANHEEMLPMLSVSTCARRR